MRKELEQEQWDRYVAWREAHNKPTDTTAGGVHSLEPGGKAPHMLKTNNPVPAAIFMGLLIVAGVIGTIVSAFV